MDGTLVNPVPVALARALGADLVICVNLNGDTGGPVVHEVPAPPIPRRSFLQVVRGRLPGFEAPSPRSPSRASPGWCSAPSTSRRTGSPGRGWSATRRTSPSGPDVAAFGLFDFHRAAEGIALGHRAARAALPRIRAVVEGRGRRGPGRPPPRPARHPPVARLRWPPARWRASNVYESPSDPALRRRRPRRAGLRPRTPRPEPRRRPAGPHPRPPVGRCRHRLGGGLGPLRPARPGDHRVGDHRELLRHPRRRLRRRAARDRRHREGGADRAAAGTGRVLPGPPRRTSPRRRSSDRRRSGGSAPRRRTGARSRSAGRATRPARAGASTRPAAA